MKRMKPILFNTDMVRAILDGRKTVTRRVVRLKYSNTHLEMFTNKYGTRFVEKQNEEPGVTTVKNPDGTTTHRILAIEEKVPPYHPGDILYVRETWRIQAAHRFEADARIEFKAGGPMTTIQFPGCRSQGTDRCEYDAFLRKWERPGWCPSIHMPKEAARLFLRVKKVSVERLQDINGLHAKAEGFEGFLHTNPLYGCPETVHNFKILWDTTIKPTELPLYGWKANPWVWVIEFAHISREDGQKGGEG